MTDTAIPTIPFGDLERSHLTSYHIWIQGATGLGMRLTEARQQTVIQYRIYMEPASRIFVICASPGEASHKSAFLDNY